MGFFFDHGFGGLILLGILGFTVLLVVLAALAGFRKAGEAFMNGWRTTRPGGSGSERRDPPSEEPQ